jgi:hypothetical protein
VLEREREREREGGREGVDYSDFLCTFKDLEKLRE